MNCIYMGLPCGSVQRGLDILLIIILCVEYMYIFLGLVRFVVEDLLYGLLVELLHPSIPIYGCSCRSKCVIFYGSVRYGRFIIDTS